MTHIETLQDYLIKNVELTRSIIEQINGYNDSLEDLRTYDNDIYFFNTFFKNDPMAAVISAQCGDYSYSDLYVMFDGYENLVSLDKYKYMQLIENNIDDIITEIKDHLILIDIKDDTFMKLLEDIKNN